MFSKTPDHLCPPPAPPCKIAAPAATPNPFWRRICGSPAKSPRPARSRCWARSRATSQPVAWSSAPKAGVTGTVSAETVEVKGQLDGRVATHSLCPARLGRGCRRCHLYHPGHRKRRTDRRQVQPEQGLIHRPDAIPLAAPPGRGYCFGQTVSGGPDVRPHPVAPR